MEATQTKRRISFHSFLGITVRFHPGFIMCCEGDLDHRHSGRARNVEERYEALPAGGGGHRINISTKGNKIKDEMDSRTEG